MCYHLSQRESNLQKIMDELEAQANFENELLPVYYHLNGFEHGNVMVLTQEDPDIIQLATWGIVPPDYSGDFMEYWKKYAGGVLNTRDDKVFVNNTWKADCMLERKCLIIVDGIYEPHKVDGHRPIPFFFEKKDRSHFLLWGIYTRHDDLITCSVLTTKANPLFAKIHNGAKRMPFCIDVGDKDYYFRLNREPDVVDEFFDFKSVDLLARPVSRDVMNSHVSSNRPDIIDSFNYPEITFNDY